MNLDEMRWDEKIKENEKKKKEMEQMSHISTGSGVYPVLSIDVGITVQ
jgi:hypothetical protein